MNNKCIGCGAALQTIDKQKMGYINPDILYSEPTELLCERCFNLKHYNKCIDVFINEKDFQKNIDKIKKDDGLIVNIVDLFDLEGTLVYDIRKLFPDNRIIMVCNKYDLFLKSTNVNRIKNYVQSILTKNNIKVSDLLIVSALKRSDIERLLLSINRLSKGKNIYFFGTTNVGKSTLINGILKYFDSDEQNLITVSNQVNTTLGFIKIPIDNGSFLIDTPGVINDRQLTYYLDKSTLNSVMPKKFVKPTIFQLNPGQTIFINGFVRIDFLSGEKSSFIFNVSNKLNCHRTKLENADTFYSSHCDDLLIIPNEDERLRLGNLVCYDYEITDDEKKDVTISGLGYVTIVGNAKIKIHTFEKINVNVRRSIV